MNGTGRLFFQGNKILSDVDIVNHALHKYLASKIRGYPS
jgi:hypothetical protein